MIPRRPADNEIGRAVAALLLELRAEAGLSQEALARAVGRPQMWVSKVERGLRHPIVPMLIRICDVVGISLTDFAERVEARIQSAKAMRAAGGAR